MADAGAVICPGCGLLVPATGATAPERSCASGECFERYGELSAYTLSLRDPEFLHQLVVDAYAAQHAGPPSKPLTTCFALVGLCLVCEHGLSGRAVQRAHRLLAEEKRDWPHFAPPPSERSLTVANVLEAPPGLTRNQAVRRWTESVWNIWHGQHSQVRALVAKWLPGNLERLEQPDRRRP